MIAHIAAAAAALALGSPAATPGVTPTQITLGATIPITGPAAAYGSVGRGADAYFKYVNSKGGVFGRKIDYKYLDDEFDVAKTITLTRQLVEQDQVFAIFNSVGTEHALAIRSYLNDRKVPQLFIGSGVSKLATEHARYPWSMGYLPSFAGEGAVYGRYIAAHRPKARIAVLYENSDFGKDMLNGLRHGLGGKGKIVGTQAYEVADADVASQLAKLKSSGADTLMLFATPKFAIFGYVGAFRLGWHPQVYVTSVSISPDIMKISRVASSRKQVEGSVSIAFVKDPTAKQWAKDRTVRLYKSIMQRFLPSAKVRRRVQLLRNGSRLHDGGHAPEGWSEPDPRRRPQGGDPSQRGESVPAPGGADPDLAQRLLPDGQGEARAVQEAIIGSSSGTS